MCNSLILKDSLIKAMTYHTFPHKLAVKKAHLLPSGISISIHGNKYNSEYRIKIIRECTKCTLKAKTIYSKIHKHIHVPGKNELF